MEQHMFLTFLVLLGATVALALLTLLACKWKQVLRWAFVWIMGVTCVLTEGCFYSFDMDPDSQL